MKWLALLFAAAVSAAAAFYRYEDPFLKRHPYPTGPIKGRPSVPPSPRRMREAGQRLIDLHDRYADQ